MHNDKNKSSFLQNVVKFSEYIIKASTINWDFRKNTLNTQVKIYTGWVIGFWQISWEKLAPMAVSVHV